MQFNPLTKELFTDEGQLIKRMHCPFQAKRNKFEQEKPDIRSKKCNICQHNVLKTAQYSDVELLNLLNEQPSTCLSLDFNQNNLTIITNARIGQK